MKVPSVFWFVLIPALVAGLVPVLTAFFPPATIWWSAAAIAIMGAIVAAVQAWRDSQIVQPPSGVQADMAPIPQKSFMRRWLIG